MKKFNLLLLISFLTINSCKKADDEDPNIIRLETDLEVSDFIWKGLNQYYYWQESVVNLSDSKKENEAEYAYYLSQNTDPELFFESLLKRKEDRFSRIFDDYNVLKESLDGTSDSDGMEYGLFIECNNQNVFGFVRYVHKNSDADAKGIKRGMIFSEINSVKLTMDNYIDVLNNRGNNYNVRFSKLSYNSINKCANIIPGEETINLTRTRLIKNPVHISKVIELDGKKIAYLMYNQFIGLVESENIDYNIELNNIFGEFKSKNIDELVIDLRYNPGGKISTSINLASMITGQFNNQVFAKEKWNSKLMNYFENNSPQSIVNKFVDKLDNNQSINSLNLTRLYVLTSSRTASASELLINGLDPYIDVIHIGDYTTGKNQGSIEIYDYINDSRDKNPNHKYAMLPIVLKIGNVAGYTDFPDGLIPDIFQTESLINPGILGDPNEPLLETAINNIFGISTSILIDEPYLEIEKPDDNKYQSLIIEQKSIKK